MKRGKGLVYYATMASGFFFIFGLTGGEVVYWKYFRKDRDEELLNVSHFSNSFSINFVSVGRKRGEESEEVEHARPGNGCRRGERLQEGVGGSQRQEDLAQVKK